MVFHRMCIAFLPDVKTRAGRGFGAYGGLRTMLGGAARGADDGYSMIFSVIFPLVLFFNISLRAP